MSTFTGFDPAALAFLRDLGDHNGRAWFDAHRAEYERPLLEPARSFVAAMGEALPALVPAVRADPRVNGSILRINRDTRFSADKRPYKTHLDLWFWQGEGPSRGCSGFFLRLEADRLGGGAGMHRFQKEALAGYRRAVDDAGRGAALDRAVREALRAGTVLGGEHWKRAPAPYAADHPRADLLRHAGLFAGTRVPVPDEAFTPAFPEWCLERFRPLRPLQAWVAEVAAGQSLAR